MSKVVAFEIKINGQKRAIKTTGDLKKAIKEVNTAIDKVEIGSKSYKNLTAEMRRLKNAQKAARDEAKAFVNVAKTSAKVAKGSYVDLNNQLVKLKKQYKELGKEARESLGGQKLRGRIASLSSELKGMDKSFGDNFRNVGNYQSAFSNFGGTLGSLAGAGGLAAAGVAAVGAAVRELAQFTAQAFRVFIEFDDKIKLLGAVSGATANQLNKLEEDAKRLGESTQFTATQVADLQIQFARVGFDSKQIIAATESTLDLALAIGEDLGEAAEVVAATLGGYQLSADETARVNNTLAASFNSSALNLERFIESSKLVAPLAKSAGVEIEQVNGTLGVLANAGLSGSVAGTGLRRVFVELQTEGSKLSELLGVTVKDTQSYNEALRRLSETELSAAQAKDLVGRNAQSVLQVFAGQSREALRLSASYVKLNAEQEAAADETLTLEQRQALVTKRLEEFGFVLEDVPRKYRNLKSVSELSGEITDNLGGDIKKLESAFDGFRIFFAETFESTARSIVQFLTKAVDKGKKIFAELVEIYRPYYQSIKNFLVSLGPSLKRGLLPVKIVLKGFFEQIKVLLKTLEIAFNLLAGTFEVFNQLNSKIEESFKNSLQKVKEFIKKTAEENEGLNEAVKDTKTLWLEVSDIMAGVYNVISNLPEAVKAAFNPDKFRGFTQLFNEGKFGAKDERENGGVTGEEQGEALAKSIIDGAVSGIDTASKKSYQKAIDELKKYQDEYEKLADSAERDKANSAGVGDTESELNAERDLQKFNTAYNQIFDKIEKLKAEQAKVREAIVPKAGSYSQLEKEVESLKEQLLNLNPDDAEFEEVKERYEELKEKLKEVAEKSGIKIEVEAEEGSIEYIENLIKSKEELQRKTSQNSTEYQKLIDEVAELTKQLEAAKLLQDELFNRAKLGDPESRKVKAPPSIGVKFDEDNPLAGIAAPVENTVLDYTSQGEFVEKSGRDKRNSDMIKSITSDNSGKKRRAEVEDYERDAKRIILGIFETTNGDWEDFLDDLVEKSKALAADVLMDISNNIAERALDRVKQAAEDELSVLEDRYQRELELAEGNEEAKARITSQYEKDKLEINRKAAREQKKIQVKQALINTALAIGKAFATVAFPASLIVAAQAAVTGAAQVAAIKQQSFADGGFTGYSTNAPDQTGQRPVGVVHDGEYVVPKKVLRTKRGKLLVDQLEAMRSNQNSLNGYFASGGFTSQVPMSSQRGASVTVVNSTAKFSDEDIAYLAEALRTGVQQGTQIGTAIGAESSNRIRERKQFLDEKRIF